QTLVDLLVDAVGQALVLRVRVHRHRIALAVWLGLAGLATPTLADTTKATAYEAPLPEGIHGPRLCEFAPCAEVCPGAVS
ncbi:hypothetical protein, partial [Clostridioides difficile]|uniref:hypothetical protein n=1 Tax=Clostridioides difficile TaxID=1496 RepID=UPI001CA5E6C0